VISDTNFQFLSINVFDRIIIIFLIKFEKEKNLDHMSYVICHNIGNFIPIDGVVVIITAESAKRL